MPTLSKQHPPSASEVAGHPLIGAVEKLLDAQPDGQWTGQSAELLALLTASASESARRARGLWPTTCNALTYRMRYVERGLKARGVLFYRTPNGKGSIHIYRTEKAAA